MNMNERRIQAILSHIQTSTCYKSQPLIVQHETAGIRIGGDFKDLARRVQSWKTFLNETVPNRISTSKRSIDINQPRENLIFDVIVIGYGAAGASAALTAADSGKKVLIIDRFDGGGSTRRSGGVYYAGGGTRAQIESGIVDDPESMFLYMKMENNGAVDDDTIRKFCNESVENFSWLENRVGVPFRDKTGRTFFYEKKVSYPPSNGTLYYSGNESAAPFHMKAKPAPRGNRAFGDYLTGNVFFSALEKSVESHPNISIRLHTRMKQLIMSSDNQKCIGVIVDELDDDFKSTHVMLHEIGSGASFLDATGEILEKCKQNENELFMKFSSSQSIFGKFGVIICTGGFFFNQEMVKKYAPKYFGYMPLGNLGDDGSGIQICEKIGCDLGRMDRCSAWKFINPPFSFIQGILINSEGNRVGNEDTYGATFADFLVQKHNGKGWLIIDQQMWDEANEDCLNPDSGLQEDQRMQGLANLHKNRVHCKSIEELAEKLQAPYLLKTFSEYNTYCFKKCDGQFGKLSKYLKPLTGDLYAIKLDMVGNKYWPTPCMSLGGVCVEGNTGLALRNNKPLNGLYVAGRAAVGICSNYYVSGLSLADAVFSGRRAGKHISKV